MKEFFGVISVACVASAVFKWIFCDGEMKQMTRFVCILTVTLCIASSLIHKEISFSLPDSVLEDTEVDGDIYEAAALPVFEAVLMDEGVPFEKILIQADKTDDGSIMISKVTVYAKEELKQTIETAILSKTEALEVEVIGD